MFTGIIQSVGEIRRLEPRGGDVRLVIGTGKLPMADVVLGDSIAVNGVCLTAVVLADGRLLGGCLPGDTVADHPGGAEPLGAR